MKKPLAIIAALAISSTVITGCGNGPNKKDISSISFYPISFKDNL